MVRSAVLNRNRYIFFEIFTMAGIYTALWVAGNFGDTPMSEMDTLMCPFRICQEDDVANVLLTATKPRKRKRRVPLYFWTLSLKYLWERSVVYKSGSLHSHTLNPFYNPRETMISVLSKYMLSSA